MLWQNTMMKVICRLSSLFQFTILHQRKSGQEGKAGIYNQSCPKVEVWMGHGLLASAPHGFLNMLSCTTWDYLPWVQLQTVWQTYSPDINHQWRKCTTDLLTCQSYRNSLSVKINSSQQCLTEWQQKLTNMTMWPSIHRICSKYNRIISLIFIIVLIIWVHILSVYLVVLLYLVFSEVRNGYGISSNSTCRWL